MASNENSKNEIKTYAVGYGKPPQETRFVKGQSGNRKGRPKGAKNLGTLLNEAGRQKVKMNEKGRVREVSKIEVMITQLINLAASGNLKAIREYLYWVRQFAEPEQAGVLPLPVPNERDSKVLKSILKRLQRHGAGGVAKPTSDR
jgi:hypothetical protein